MLRSFPWVLDVFGISGYHFYKLIEVAIKLERDFPRGIIKHLNRVSLRSVRLPWEHVCGCHGNTCRAPYVCAGGGNGAESAGMDVWIASL